MPNINPLNTTIIFFLGFFSICGVASGNEPHRKSQQPGQTCSSHQELVRGTGQCFDRNAVIRVLDTTYIVEGIAKEECPEGAARYGQSVCLYNPHYDLKNGHLILVEPKIECPTGLYQEDNICSSAKAGLTHPALMPPCSPGYVVAGVDGVCTSYRVLANTTANENFGILPVDGNCPDHRVRFGGNDFNHCIASKKLVPCGDDTFACRHSKGFEYRVLDAEPGCCPPTMSPTETWGPSGSEVDSLTLIPLTACAPPQGGIHLNCKDLGWGIDEGL